MTSEKSHTLFESLEPRHLFATWSGYASIVDQPRAAEQFPDANGKGTTIAIIDTGIDYMRRELGGGIGANFKVIGGYDFFDDDANPMDTSGHGTAVASVIAGNTFTYGGRVYQGVAPKARLVALRVGTDDNITDNRIEEALQWVIDNHDDFNISVVNLSLGSGFYPERQTDSQFSDEFAELRELGIFVVAASGNSNDAISGPIGQDGIAYPSADPNVFAVGAIDSTDIITSWSQRSTELDLLAPGENIVMPDLDDGYVVEDGTSFASPYVAGAAALIKQMDPSAKAGDIGSILMASGEANRDGDEESGNTTGLQFSRLNINQALALVKKRAGKHASLNFGEHFDTALDSNGILHASWYDTRRGWMLYATRDADGLWSDAILVDRDGDVGAQPTLAVDTSGKAGLGYYDITNGSVKYASFNGYRWPVRAIESGVRRPSLAFDIDGNGYLAYYQRTGGNLRLATLNRDTNAWSAITVDGADSDVGAALSLDVGEAAIRSSFGFTFFDTTVAIAYVDSTNGDLKYARLDIDDPQAAWFIAVVDDANGIRNPTLDLHPGPLNAGLQAQIVYQDLATFDVKYAYRNTDWFTETVATTGRVGDTIQVYFDEFDDPIAVYYNTDKKTFYSASRIGADNWSTSGVVTGAGPMTIGYNERTGEAVMSYLNRSRTAVNSLTLT